MIGVIAAVSREGVIGKDGDIPWSYPEDLKRFKKVTLGSTIIMGRNTWESFGSRQLPKRRNIVITRQTLEDVECFSSIEQALETCEGDVWLIGGRRIYEAGMQLCDVIDLTYVPESVDPEGAVLFPPIDEAVWEGEGRLAHETDPRLQREIFRRRRLATA